MRFRGYSWTAGARKHGVSREQARHVVEHCGPVQVREAARRIDQTRRFCSWVTMRQAQSSRSPGFFWPMDDSE